MRKKAYTTRTEKHCNQKWKLRDEDEDTTDISHTTISTTKSKSWECPPYTRRSTRRKLIPGTLNISARRASLRSSKRLFETGMTSCSRSSQPHKSSEISPATDVTKQLDHTAREVTKSYLVPSSSKSYLQEVVHPSTLELEMINDKETEQAGNSLSNQSTQMEGQNIFEAESTPHGQEPFPLPENVIQASDNSERANHSNSVSMVGLVSPSLSSKLTDIVNIANMLDDDDDDDEIDSVEKTTDRYRVRPEFEPILRKIEAKHGDIAKNCTHLTMKDRSKLLEVVCGILSEIKEHTYFSSIKEGFLRSKIALLNDIKNTTMEVEWLHRGLVKMLAARELLDQCGMLKEKRENTRKAIEDADRKMEECDKRKQELSALFKSICEEEVVCKETQAKAREESTAITGTIKYVTSTVRPFLYSSPLDALL